MIRDPRRHRPSASRFNLVFFAHLSLELINEVLRSSGIIV